MNRKPKPLPIVVFVYGFQLEDNEILVPKEGSELFCLPYYGVEQEEGGTRYIGIKFGEIESPFDRLYSVEPDEEFVMCDLKPTKEIIEKMSSLYGDRNLEPMAYMKGVYTSHYLSGVVMYGQFVDGLIRDEEKREMDDFFKLNKEGEQEKKERIDLYRIGHNLIGDRPGQVCLEHFVGCQLSSDFVTFEEGETRAGHKFYKMLTKTYTYTNDLTFKFKPKMVSSQKMIAFIPQMCHCCT
jgi:hypothetical protein